jgi:hypothetical protein
MGFMGLLGDIFKGAVEGWTDEAKKNKRTSYLVTNSGFYALRAHANALTRACRSRQFGLAQHTLVTLEKLAADLTYEVGTEQQTYRQLCAIVETAYACVDAAQRMQTIYNPISAFARSYGNQMPDTVAPRGPYLNCEAQFLNACDALIEQGDKYLNPDPTVANYTEFDRYGNRRNDPYNQEDGDDIGFDGHNS